MTAPAVARPWSPGAADLPRAVASFLRARAVGIRQAAPLGAVLFTTLVAHVAVGPHLALWGAAPDVLLVGVTAVAAGRGPRAGAAFGFASGLGADLFLATPPGTSALAFTLVGHALGQTGPARSPGRSSGVAAALCSPNSTCFACRAGRLHTAAPLEVGESGLGGVPPDDESQGLPEWSLTAQRGAIRGNSSRGTRRYLIKRLAVAPASVHRSTAEPRASVRPRPAARPARRRRRAVARRASVRRTLVLTGTGVGIGRLATAAVATCFGSVPFQGVPGLLRITAVAAVSAPYGLPVFAAVRRLPKSDSGVRHR
jgi:hypothetical protein